MSQVHVSNHPLVRHKLTMLRDMKTEHKKFRELVREMAILLAYEATDDMALRDVIVTSPLGRATGHVLEQKIGLVPVLRAGLGMVEGIWEMMPSAEVWHIGLFRDERPCDRWSTITSCLSVQRLTSVWCWILCWPLGVRLWRWWIS